MQPCDLFSVEPSCLASLSCTGFKVQTRLRYHDRVDDKCECKCGSEEASAVWILQAKGGQGPPFEVNGLRVVQKDQNPNLVRISVLMLLVLWLLQRWLLE